ncbi:hypothetical protein TUM18999_56740 [Pseudomonas tohonis]|uniref:MobA-like NTP transferase domain-containing protein n=1 Tax=Pseudomonas tohonis TaxID=2725477 RepID=A0A6J4EC58_9PSED|nr:hypothetical protein [Pseudomonas tohonis]BCG27483.1 hypothetical protein TUM18999_56740 [Pseudomonas tohonis]GJN52988.1 hypothetical protein TUM20286_27400 [Pseudomonas tohonis]
MTGITVLILAAETGQKLERWERDALPKQFIEVQGETLIGRTLRLLSEQGITMPWLVTASSAFAALPAISWCPLNSETKAHSLLAAESLWVNGDLLVLYSDVYYSEAAFKSLLSISGTRFLGRSGRSAYTFKNYGELFAIRIASEDRSAALDALARMVLHHQRTNDQSFWNFYRLMAGLPLDGESMEQRLFIDVHDETDDVDFVEDVPMLLEAIEKPLRWRARYLLRRLSLLNKARRDRARALPVGRGRNIWTAY